MDYPAFSHRRWNVFTVGRYFPSMMALSVFQNASSQDTVVLIAARDGYDILQALAAASVAATFLGVLLLIAYGLLQTRRVARTLHRARQSFSADPAVESIRRTASNVESISQTLNDEVAKLSESVSSLSDRLTQASDRMEERIEEFNAFMEVVQREAEGAFVDGAATAHGVRAGLGNLSNRRREQRRERTSSENHIVEAPSQRVPLPEVDAEDFEPGDPGPSGATDI